MTAVPTLPRFLLIPLLAAILALSASAQSGSPSEWFIRGNIAYGNGSFAEAADAYREVLKTHVSPEVHYNLGNALAKEDRWSEAATHYLAAYALDPGLEAARANLLLAAQRLDLDTDYPLLPQPANLLSPRAWTWVAAGGFWLALVLCVHPLVGNFRFPLRKTLACLCLLAVGTAVLGLIQHQHFQQWGIIASDEASLRVAPTSQSPGEASVFQGEPVRVLNEQGTFLHVQTRNGVEGFVLKDELHRVGKD